MLHVDIAIDIATRHPVVASPLALHLFLTTPAILDRATVQPTLEFGTFSATSASSSSPLPSPPLKFSSMTNELCSRATDATVSHELGSHGGLAFDHMVGEFLYRDVADHTPSPEKGSSGYYAFRAMSVPHEVSSTLVPPLPPLVFGTLFPIVNTSAVDPTSSKSTSLDVVPAFDAPDTSTILRSALATTDGIASPLNHSALPAAIDLRADVSALYSTDDYCETVNNVLLFGSIITAGMQTELRSRGERSSLVTINPSEKKILSLRSITAGMQIELRSRGERSSLVTINPSEKKILSLRSITAGMQTELCSRVEHSNLETYYKKKKKILLLRSITAGLQTELCSRGERGSQETIDILPSLIPIAAIEQSELLCSRVQLGFLESELCFLLADSELQCSPPFHAHCYCVDNIPTTRLLCCLTSPPLSAPICDVSFGYADSLTLPVRSGIASVNVSPTACFKFTQPLVVALVCTLTCQRTTCVLSYTNDLPALPQPPCSCRCVNAVPPLLCLIQTVHDPYSHLASTRGLTICLAAGVFVSLRRPGSSLMLECRCYASSGLDNCYFLHSHRAVASYSSRFMTSTSHLLTDDGIVYVSPPYHVLQVLNPNLAVLFGFTEVDSPRRTRFISPQFPFTELDAADTTLAKQLLATRQARLLTTDWNCQLEPPWPGCNPASKVRVSPQSYASGKIQPPDRFSSQNSINSRYNTHLTSWPLRFINANLVLHLDELLLFPSLLHGFPNSFVTADTATSVVDLDTVSRPSTAVLSNIFPVIEVSAIPCYHRKMTFRDPLPSANPSKYSPHTFVTQRAPIACMPTSLPVSTQHPVCDAISLFDPGTVLALYDAIVDTLAVPVVLSCFDLKESTCLGYGLCLSDIADSLQVPLASDSVPHVYWHSWRRLPPSASALEIVVFTFRCEELGQGTWSPFFLLCDSNQRILFTLTHAASLPLLAIRQHRHSRLLLELARCLLSDVVDLESKPTSWNLRLLQRRFQKDSDIRLHSPLRDLDVAAIRHTATRYFSTSALIEYCPWFDNRTMTDHVRLHSSTPNVCASNAKLWVGQARILLQSSTSTMEVDSLFAIIALIQTAFALNDNHMYWKSCITDCIDIPNLLQEYFERNVIYSALHATVARPTRLFSDSSLTRLAPPTRSLSHALSAIGNPLDNDCSNSQPFVSRKSDKENLRPCLFSLSLLPALSHPSHLESQSASKLLWLTNTVLLVCTASSISSDMRKSTELEQDLSIAYTPPCGAPFPTLAAVFSTPFSELPFTCLHSSSVPDLMSPKTATVIPNQKNFRIGDSLILPYHILRMFSDLLAFRYRDIILLANLLFLSLFFRKNVRNPNSINGATYHNMAFALSGLASPSLHNHSGTYFSARNILSDINLSIGHTSAEPGCQLMDLATASACHFPHRRTGVFRPFESLTRLHYWDSPIPMDRSPRLTDIPFISKAINLHNAIVLQIATPQRESYRCDEYKPVSSYKVLVFDVATIYGYLSFIIIWSHLNLHVAMPVPDLAATDARTLPACVSKSRSESIASFDTYGFANTYGCIQEGEFSALQAQPVLGIRVPFVATIGRSPSPAYRSTHVLTILETSFLGGYQATVTSSTTLRTSTCVLLSPLEGGFLLSLQWQQAVLCLSNSLLHQNDTLILSLQTVESFTLRSPPTGSGFNAIILLLDRCSRMMVTNHLLSNISGSILSSRRLSHASVPRICSQSIISHPQIYSSTLFELNARNYTPAYRFVDVNHIMRTLEGVSSSPPNQGLLANDCTSPYLVASTFSEAAGILRGPVTATSASNLYWETAFPFDVSFHLALTLVPLLRDCRVAVSACLSSWLLRITFECVLSPVPMSFGYSLLASAVSSSSRRLRKNRQISCHTISVTLALDMEAAMPTSPGCQSLARQFCFPLIRASPKHSRQFSAVQLPHQPDCVMQLSLTVHSQPGTTWFVHHGSEVSVAPRQFLIRLMAYFLVTVLLNLCTLGNYLLIAISVLGLQSGFAHLECSKAYPSYCLPPASILCSFLVASPQSYAFAKTDDALLTALHDLSRRLSDKSMRVVNSSCLSVAIGIFGLVQSLLRATISSVDVLLWTSRLSFLSSLKALIPQFATCLDPKTEYNPGGLQDSSFFRLFRVCPFPIAHRHDFLSSVFALFNHRAKFITSGTVKIPLANHLPYNFLLQRLVNHPFPPASTLRLCGHFLAAFCVYCDCLCSQSMDDEYMHPLSEPDLWFCTPLNQFEIHSRVFAIVLLSYLTLLTVHLFSRHALLFNAILLARSVLVAVIALALYAVLRSSQSGVHFSTHPVLLVPALFKLSLNAISCSLITCTIIALLCAGNAAFNRRIQYCLAVLFLFCPALCHLQMRRYDHLCLLQSELRQSMFLIERSVAIVASTFTLYLLEHLSGCQLNVSHLLALCFQPLYLDNRLQLRLYENCHRTSLEDTCQHSTSFVPTSRYLWHFLHSDYCISLQDFAPRTWRVLCWLASTLWKRFRYLSSLTSIKPTPVIEHRCLFILFEFLSASASLAEYFDMATLFERVSPFSVPSPEYSAAAQQCYPLRDAHSLHSKWVTICRFLVIAFEVGLASFDISHLFLVLRNSLAISSPLCLCTQRTSKRCCLSVACMKEFRAMMKRLTRVPPSPRYFYFSSPLVRGLRQITNCIRSVAIIVLHSDVFRLLPTHPSCHSLSHASRRILTCTYYHAQKWHQNGRCLGHALLSQTWYDLWQPTGIIYLPRRRLCFSYVFASEEIGLFCLPCDSAGVDSHLGFQTRLPSSTALRSSLSDALSFALFYLSRRMVNLAYDTSGDFSNYNFMVCSLIDPFKAVPLKLTFYMSTQVHFELYRFSSSLPIVLNLMRHLSIDEFASCDFPLVCLFSSALGMLAPASATFFKFVAAVFRIKTQTALLHVWLSTRAVQWLRTFLLPYSPFGTAEPNIIIRNSRFKWFSF